MTWANELDLNIMKTQLQTKMKFLGRGCQKLEHEQERQYTQTRIQTDATERITSRIGRW